MAIRTLSASTVDAHVESAPKTATKTKKNAGDVYKAARPVMIQAVGILKLVKPTWGKVLEGLIEALDDTFPAATK